MSALELPALPPLGGAPSLSGGAPLAVYVDLPAGEEPVTIAPLDPDGAGLALGTAHGVVKRVVPDHPARSDWEVVVAQGRRPRRRRREPARRLGRPRVRDLGRPAAPVPGLRRAAAGSRGRRHGRHPALPRRHRHVLRRPRTRRRRPGGHLQRVLRRAARDRAGLAQGHAVRRLPRQGPWHRRGSRPPIPAGRGRPRAGLGRAGTGARLRPRWGRGGASRRRPASATARERRTRWSSPACPRPCPEDARQRWSQACYSIVTANLRHVVAPMRKRFYVWTRFPHRRGHIPSRRDQ